MDAGRFDSLVRSLPAPSRRGFSCALTGLGLGGAIGSLLGLTTAEAKKNKKKKKCKKKCGECQKCKKGKCKLKPDGTPCSNGQACQGGTCPCADCRAGEECLANGSCATVCTLSGDCPAECLGCSLPNVEGAQHCIGDLIACESAQACTSTAQCPEGQHCQGDICAGQTCVPLCPG